LRRKTTNQINSNTNNNNFTRTTLINYDRLTGRVIPTISNYISTPAFTLPLAGNNNVTSITPEVTITNTNDNIINNNNNRQINSMTV
jgi:hypothetical protein